MELQSRSLTAPCGDRVLLHPISKRVRGQFPGPIEFHHRDIYEYSSGDIRPKIRKAPTTAFSPRTKNRGLVRVPDEDAKFQN